MGPEPNFSRQAQRPIPANVSLGRAEPQFPYAEIETLTKFGSEIP
jgi:hypothetical protein